MNTIFKTAAILLILALGSCSQEKKIFKTDVITENEKNSITFTPNMDFKKSVDSAFYYFNQDDYKKTLSGEVKLGEDIYSNNNFKVKVILREFPKPDRIDYEILLRTYGKDLRIIDSFVIGSTVKGELCHGYLTNDLNVIRYRKNGTMLAGHINELGKFLIPKE
ncbi:MAG: hypothetical protein ACSHWW_10220 [Nonlabens sp.]|uniref:hypothetical protein n=1 Tax=Nonlabens sp. TaxID=1888209 RepID=UPI003EF5E809